MGTWGYDSFDNDAACDWAWDLVKTRDLKFVKQTLQQALKDELMAAEGIAACEVIARLKGNWGRRDAYSEDLDAWVLIHTQPPPQELVELAIRVLDVVSNESSEAHKSWKSSNGSKEWLECIDDLRRRVAAQAH